MSIRRSEQVRALGGETPLRAFPRFPSLTGVAEREIFLSPPPPARAAVENPPVSGVYPWLHTLPGTYLQSAGSHRPVPWGWLRSVHVQVGTWPWGSVKPNPKRRIPRKSKKWHRKHGWTPHFDAKGRVYFTRSYLIGRWPR